MGVRVLGTDIGFASFGVAVVELGDAAETVYELDVIRTDKSSKKSNVLATEDNIRRTREICVALRALIRRHNIRAICGEAMSFPRSSSVAGKMCLAWGVVAALTVEFDLPLVQCTPMQLKKAVCGNKSAAKEDVETALLERYGDAVDRLFTGLPSQREHCFDALGSVVAGLDSEVLRMARKAA